MNADTMTLHSSIKPSLKKKIMFRGTLISAIGLIPMFYGSLYLDVPTLSYWGVPIFFGSLGMIAVGMLPFKRLTFLENNPNKLTINDNDGFIYSHKGKKTLTIPISAIDNISYYEKNSMYGVALSLKKDLEDKIVVHNQSFDFARYSNYSKKHYQCELFLPYFSRRAFKELLETS